MPRERRRRWVGRLRCATLDRSSVLEVAHAAAEDEETGHRDLRGRTGRWIGRQQPVCLGRSGGQSGPRRHRRAAGGAAVAAASAGGVPPRRRLRVLPPPPPPIAAPPPPPSIRSPAARRSARGHPAAPQPTVIPEGTPAGQDPTPYTGQPVFAPPTFNPLNGSDGGRGQADLHQLRAADRRPAAGPGTPCTSRRFRRSPASSTGPATPSCGGGRIDFWPANTVVNIDAGGTKSSFRTGAVLVATVDDATHQMTVVRNGTVEKTFPVSMGKTGHDTDPNGTYYVLEKFPTHRDGLLDVRRAGQLGAGLQAERAERRADRQQRQLRAQRAVVGRRSGQAQRQPRLHQPQPGQRAVVLRQLRQRRPGRREELRRALYNQPDGASRTGRCSEPATASRAV